MSKENKNSTKKTIKPGKDLLSSKVQGLKEQLISFIDQGVKEITIDFSGIEKIDAEGLGLLIASNNSLKKIGGKLKIKNVSGKIYKFIQTIHLDKQFEVVSPG